MTYCEVENLKIDQSLFDFVENELAPQTAFDAAHIWKTLSILVDGFESKIDVALKIIITKKY